MKKRIFLNVPRSISAQELETMRSFYRKQGFLVTDPKMLQNDLNHFRVTAHADFNDGQVIAYCCEKIAGTQAMVLAKNWQSDEDCNFFLRFSCMNNIPVFREYSDKRLSIESQIKTKITGAQKDPFILSSEMEEIEQPESGRP